MPQFRRILEGMSKVIIRQATYLDLPQITEIYNDAVLNSTATFDLDPVTEEERRRWLAAHGEGYPVLVAEDQEFGVLAWGSLSPFAQRPAYRFTVEHSIYVDKNFRGRGIGRSLLIELLQLSKELGYHSMIGKITGDNLLSIAMHQKYGFTEVGRLQDVGFKFDRWLDVLLMQKHLK